MGPSNPFGRIRYRHLAIVILTIALQLASCVSQIQDESRVENHRQVANLAAFARLYGYVRYFHPSDEAANVDWDRFVIYGSSLVLEATSDRELRQILKNLFLPIAPSACIYIEESECTNILVIDPPIDAKVVAWQHYGAGLGDIGPTYKSIRLNRLNRQPESLGQISQTLDANLLRGRNIKLRAAVRAEVLGDQNSGQLWLRTENLDNKHNFLQNMREHPIVSNQWKIYEVDGVVAEDAIRVSIGAFLKGKGKLWVDDIQLLSEDPKTGKWSSINLVNSGFESKNIQGWMTSSQDHLYTLDTEKPSAGKIALRIESKFAVLTSLFPEHPTPKEILKKPISANMKVKIPLALYGDDEHTFPVGDILAKKKLEDELVALGDITQLMAADSRVRCAGVIIMWNIFQHFYPYFDSVPVDWMPLLPEALKEALSDTSAEDYQLTLRKLAAAAMDGHANVLRPKEVTYYPPFSLDWVEGHIVVTKSADTKFKVGDIVWAVDGRDAADLMRAKEDTVSGSPQWRRKIALQRLITGDKNESIDVAVLRNHERITQPVIVDTPISSLFLPSKDHIKFLGNGIWYVNLTTASMSEIDERISDLSQARSVIFDLRGYPKDNAGVLAYLINATDSEKWMKIPKIIYPDHERAVGEDSFGWNMKPRVPHVGGKLFFLTNSSAISFSESILAYVEGYQLGDIVGTDTAGANGNIRKVNLPGSFSFTFTGMRVVKFDGKQLHNVGIQPTVPASMTVEGLREGKDEVLEKAIRLAN